jgi:AcrR family transcriptional regulator
MSSTAARIRAAATGLFAERGYDGTSVRAICTAAGANVNAISYHFGGKRELFVDLIRGLGDQRLASAHRILGAPADTLAEVHTRLLLFAQETLAAWLAEPELLMILFAELQLGFRNCGPEAVASLGEQRAVLESFLGTAQQSGLLRPGVNVGIVAGTLIERLSNQVIYMKVIHASYGASIKDEEYRRTWTRQIIDLLLFGAAVAPTPAPNP